MPLNLVSPRDVLAAPTLRKAAQYVRMSTDHQRYSVENQKQAIAEYASSHGFDVVKTYIDTARSGLTLHGRKALQRLIADVRDSAAGFDVVLVYDVSRWGRFQDIDESAHYEFVCKKAGVAVEYCAEEFRNDGSLVTTLIKGMKRAMAGEFSRELSTKVFAGHKRLARLGFHQGGTSSFGLRRVLVDSKRRPKGPLKYGELKNLQTDRVILVPGPPEEVRVVREIFRLYVVNRFGLKAIARLLNERGILTERRKKWCGTSIYNLLANERYVGNLVYNRTSLKLQSKRSNNSQTHWIRAERVIEPIIDRDMFAAAQRRLKAAGPFSDADLLNHLTAVWCVKGYLSCGTMREISLTPVPNTYRDRFGSLNNAFKLIGYRPTHHYRSVRISPLLRKIERDIFHQLTSCAERQGLAIEVDSEAGTIRVGDRSILIVVVPFMAPKSRQAGWRLYFDRWAKSDIIFLARLARSNSEILDYHLLPFPLLPRSSFRFTDENLTPLTGYRVDPLAIFGDVLRERFLSGPGVSCS